MSRVLGCGKGDCDCERCRLDRFFALGYRSYVTPEEIAFELGNSSGVAGDWSAEAKAVLALLERRNVVVIERGEGAVKARGLARIANCDCLGPFNESCPRHGTKIATTLASKLNAESRIRDQKWEIQKLSGYLKEAKAARDQARADALRYIKERVKAHEEKL